MFDLDEMCNGPNDRIWVINRIDADAKSGIKREQSFPKKVMIWLGVCSKGATPLIIFDEGTLDHERYIKEVVPMAKKIWR
ncbi:unnamed protein product [Rotaria sordida]|uniref:Uncharacterized protein n=1 Tax=Rotaria sordida TaxID=392033 RepID=A0A813QTT4_9BILA|nr:unnamed protein product [Rotaria sordida]